MYAIHRRTTLALVLLAAVGFAGCSDSTDVNDTSFDPAQVEQAALTVVSTVPQIDAAEQSIFAMLGEIGGPAPVTEFDPVNVPSHTEGFDLGNGVTGTMDVSSNGEFSFSFSGTVSAGSDTLTVNGSMLVSPTADQPASGARYAIDYQVTAAGLGAIISWGASGVVTVDEGGQVTDFQLTIALNVTGSNGANASVTTVVSPSSYEMTAIGPFQNVTRFVVDRSSLTGSVYVNNQLVANLVISGYCVEIDYVNEDYTDVSVCPQE